MSDVSMRQLLEAGVHFGHQTRFWCPKMSPYIYGERNKIHIINLEHTLPMYREAMNFLGQLASRKGTILFVGTKRQAGPIVKEQAERIRCPYVDYRWLGGMMTNFKTVRNSIARLKDIETRLEDGSVERMRKKDALKLRREHEKLDRSLGGIKNMERLPDALFVVDVDHERIAVSEANKLGIPVIAVVDTNCSPDGVDHVIPGNDDSIRAIRLYLTGVSDAILEARQAAQVSIESEDEYVEIDESTEELTTDSEKSETETVTAKASAEENASAESAEKEVGEKPAPRKIVRKKKVTKVTAAAKKEKAQAEEKTEGQVEAKSTDAKTGKVAKTRKKPAKEKTVEEAGEEDKTETAATTTE